MTTNTSRIDELTRKRDEAREELTKLRDRESQLKLRLAELNYDLKTEKRKLR